MPDRRPIKDKHETCYIEAFLRWHSRSYGSNFHIKSRPDPPASGSPDAIIESRYKTSWIEVGDVYWSDRWAEDQNSFATPGETHKKICQGFFAEMDAQFALRFVKVLKNKMEKKSYAIPSCKYGPGYLVLPMMSPLFDNHTVHLMREYWNKCQFIDLGYFRSVYIAYLSRNEITFSRWHIRPLQGFRQNRRGDI